MLLIHLVLIVITSQIMELSNFTITDEIFSLIQVCVLIIPAVEIMTYVTGSVVSINTILYQSENRISKRQQANC